MADQTQLYRTPPTTGTSREIEAWALTEAALRMKAAKDINDREAILGTARLNWRLWTLFQAELLDPDCPLPEPLRSNLVSLAAFIDRHTVEILAQPEAGRLDVLININRDLAMGLLATPPADETVAPAQPQQSQSGSALPQDGSGINISA